MSLSHPSRRDFLKASGAAAAVAAAGYPSVTRAADASKKLKGTMWVDEADRQVAHADVTFDDNFHVAGGLVANVQKGTNFHFDQAPVEEQLWLPTGGEGTLQARVLLFKNMRQHFSERDYDYKRFKVEAQQAKDAKVVSGAKQ
jgi:hypothetical protein